MLSSSAVEILFLLEDAGVRFISDIYSKMPETTNIESTIRHLCGMGLVEERQDIFISLSASGKAVTGSDPNPSKAVCLMLNRLGITFPATNPNILEKNMEYHLPKHSARLFLEDEEKALLIELSKGPIEAPVPFPIEARNLEIRGFVSVDDKGILALTERGEIELDFNAIKNKKKLYLPFTEYVAKNRLQRLFLESAAQTPVGNFKINNIKSYLQSMGISEWLTEDIKKELSIMEKTGHVYFSGNNMYYLQMEWMFLFGIKPLTPSMLKRVILMNVFGTPKEKVLDPWLEVLGCSFNDKKKIWETTPKTRVKKKSGSKKSKRKPSSIEPAADSLSKEENESGGLSTDESMRALEVAAEEQSTEAPQWDLGDDGAELDTDAMLKESIEFMDSLVERANAKPKQIINKEQKVTFLKHLSNGLFFGNEAGQVLINSIVDDLESE
jgi:hypothetical protein